MGKTTKKTFKRKINPNQEQAKLYDKITYLQTRIIQKTQQLKKTKFPSFSCDHFSHPGDQIKYQESTNYYEKFWKEYLLTVFYYKHMQQMEEGVQLLENSVQQIQKKVNERDQILRLPAFSGIRKSNKGQYAKKEKSQKQNHRQKQGQSQRQGQQGLSRDKDQDRPLKSVLPDDVIKKEEVENMVYQEEESQSQILKK